MPALYIHIPFCKSKCPYCGFYSVPSVESSVTDRYLDACIRELASLPPVSYDTIYIGGGTPSHIGAERLSGFISTLLSTIDFAHGEFTIELNPESTSEALLTALDKHPVSRYSIGIQSLNDDVLRLLGRAHSAEQAAQAVRLARQSGRDINLDLIYDVPGVERNIIIDSMHRIIDAHPSHISAYSYSPDTGYLASEPSADPEQTLLVGLVLQNGGYKRYEISNYSLKGHHSIHNMKYWRMEEYTGIGAGAHSLSLDDDGGLRWSHIADINAYINNPTAKDDTERYNHDELAREGLIFGLRMIGGVNISELECRFAPLPDILKDKIAVLVDKGLLKKEGNNICATKKGLLLLDSVMSFLW